MIAFFLCCCCSAAVDDKSNLVSRLTITIPARAMEINKNDLHEPLLNNYNKEARKQLFTDVGFLKDKTDANRTEKKNANHVIIHKVTRSDTIQGLALQYGVSLYDIKRCNLMSNDRLTSYLELKIPVSSSSKTNNKCENENEKPEDVMTTTVDEKKSRNAAKENEPNAPPPQERDAKFDALTTNLFMLLSRNDSAFQTHGPAKYYLTANEYKLSQSLHASKMDDEWEQKQQHNANNNNNKRKVASNKKIWWL